MSKRVSAQQQVMSLLCVWFEAELYFLIGWREGGVVCVCVCMCMLWLSMSLLVSSEFSTVLLAASLLADSMLSRPRGGGGATGDLMLNH